MAFWDKLFKKNKNQEEVNEELNSEQREEENLEVIEEKSEEKTEIAEEEIEETTETIAEKEIEEATETIAKEEMEETTETIAEENEENTEMLEEEIGENIEITEEETEEIQEPAEKKKGFFAKLKEGLTKTKESIMNGVDNVLSSFTKIDEDLFEELEEALIMSDIGVETTQTIIEGLRERVKKARVTDVSEVKQLLIDEITEILEADETEFNLSSPSVVLVIGVNGVGKTTTIGKLANIYKQQGKKVLLAAADTFRAAAIDQLEVWGKRSDIDVIKHQENSDPAAVVYDAVQAAKARKTDVLICDTAGRLHNKKNLMEELRKIFKIIGRDYPEAQKEVLLVLDGTTGQNALQQAKVFKEVADITGIVLTKLDGTAKGGIVISIKSELKIPVRFVGVGEGVNDLQEFNASDFAKALFE